MPFLGPFHPQIVHTPIVMLIFSAFLAIQSGKPAHRVPEHEQGVPEKDIDEHGEGGERVMYLAGGALVVLGIASRLQGTAANALSIVALLLQIGAAMLVG